MNNVSSFACQFSRWLVFLLQQAEDPVILPLAIEKEVLPQRPFLNKARSKYELTPKNWTV